MALERINKVSMVALRSTPLVPVASTRTQALAAPGPSFESVASLVTYLMLIVFSPYPGTHRPRS